MQVHFDTFKPTETYVANGKEYQRHTVEVSIGNDRRTVKCSGIYNGWVEVYGLAVRFQTGAKVWPGSVTYWVESGKANAPRPNIDKRGHVSLVGFYEDYKGKAVQSQHNAVA